MKIPDYAINWILNAEGRYVDDPDDSGGPTNYGISTNLLELAKRKYPDKYGHIKDVTEVDKDLAIDIYETVFWNYYKLSRYKYPMDLLMFDSYVQHNPKAVGTTLQRSINVINKIYNKPKISVDGIIGPITLEAYYDLAEDDDLHNMLCIEFIFRRVLLYSIIAQRDEVKRKFLPGWINRMGNLHAYVFDKGIA